MLESTISINEIEGAFTLRHAFDRPLFLRLLKVDGGRYLKEHRCWIFSIIHHNEEVKQVLQDHNTKVKVERTTESLIRLYPNLNVLSENEKTLLDRFTNQMLLRNTSFRTIELYCSALKRFLLFHRGIEIEKLSSEDIEGYLLYLITVRQFKHTTLNVHISAIKAFYKYTIKKEKNITIDRPKSKKELPKVLSRQEIQAMIKFEQSSKHRLVLLIFYSTGIRRSELINIMMRDIDLEARTILIYGKGRKQRIVYICDHLEKELKNYIEINKPTKYLFPGQPGEKYSGTSVLNIVKGAAEKAGIERNVTPHMLGHSYATHMLTSGISPVHIQKLLGHSSIKTTMIYTHLADEDLRNLRNPLDTLGLEL